MSDLTVLVVPGWTNSGPDHWQSRWEREFGCWRRVEQRDWDAPERDEWCATLADAVAAAPGPVALVAHSLGCLTVVHAAPRLGARVHAALLVAPPDVERAGAIGELRGFAPVPLAPLPFRARVVASRTDPWCAIERASAFAAAWGCAFTDAGDEGHLNTAAGRGDWPEGRAILRDLLQGS